MNRKSHPKTSTYRQKIRTILVVLAAIFSLLLVNMLWNIAIGWLVGVHLGYNLFDRNLTDTERAQISVAMLIIDGFTLLILRHTWLKRRQLRFWRYVRTTALVLAIISFTAGVIEPSVQFIIGQRGGDYGCSHNIGLQQAYNASFPIYTDTSGGTAFAIDTHGTMLTAYHVIDGAKTINIGDDKGRALKVIRVNKAYDVALLKYNQPTPDYLPLTETYQIADPVYAIGWPENADDAGQGTITSGIISRFISSADVQNSEDNQPKHLSYIQTDAAINEGNSGGPLLDTCGVVGVINSGSTTGEGSDKEVQQGINYATSTEAVKYALHLK